MGCPSRCGQVRPTSHASVGAWVRVRASMHPSPSDIAHQHALPPPAARSAHTRRPTAGAPPPAPPPPPSDAQQHGLARHGAAAPGATDTLLPPPLSHPQAAGQRAGSPARLPCSSTAPAPQPQQRITTPPPTPTPPPAAMFRCHGTGCRGRARGGCPRLRSRQHVPALQAEAHQQARAGEEVSVGEGARGAGALAVRAACHDLCWFGKLVSEEETLRRCALTCPSTTANCPAHGTHMALNRAWHAASCLCALCMSNGQGGSAFKAGCILCPPC